MYSDEYKRGVIYLAVCKGSAFPQHKSHLMIPLKRFNCISASHRETIFYHKSTFIPLDRHSNLISDNKSC